MKNPKQNKINKTDFKNAQILNNKSLNEIKNAQREALIKSFKVNNIPLENLRLKK